MIELLRRRDSPIEGIAGKYQLPSGVTQVRSQLSVLQQTADRAGQCVCIGWWHQ
jgi:hypothetical protein